MEHKWKSTLVLLCGAVSHIYEQKCQFQHICMIYARVKSRQTFICYIPEVNFKTLGGNLTPYLTQCKNPCPNFQPYLKCSQSKSHRQPKSVPLHAYSSNGVRLNNHCLLALWLEVGQDVSGIERQAAAAGGLAQALIQTFLLIRNS